jgi:hypothetical protein
MRHILILLSTLGLLLLAQGCPSSVGDDDDSSDDDDTGGGGDDDDDTTVDDDDDDDTAGDDDDSAGDDDDSAGDDDDSAGDDDDSAGDDDDSAAPSGPSVLIAADRDGDLYSLEPQTGAETFLLDTWTLDSVGAQVPVGVVSSIIEWTADGLLWLGTGGNAECDGCVMNIDPTSGEATMLADNSGSSYAMPGMARSPADEVFTMEGDGSGFYDVDPLTGVSSEISGDIDATWSNYQGNSLTFGSDGTMYASSNGMFYTMDPVAGIGTQVAEQSYIGFPGNPDLSRYYLVSMATLGDGTIYGLLKETGGAAATNSWLVTVDPTTAELTAIAELTARFDGLAAVESVFQ